MRLDELAAKIDATLEGDPAVEVTGCATLDEAGPGTVSFLHAAKYASRISGTKASALIVGQNFRAPAGVTLPLLRVKDPYFGFRNAIVLLHGLRQPPAWAAKTPIHPLAYVDPTATVGEGTVIYPFAYVGPEVVIGRNCTLHPHATVYERCRLGDRVILHAGAVVGVDGFGFATHARAGEPPLHHKIPQAGIAVIENDVEIGAGSCIDRATVGQTVVAKGTKISDLVIVGHNTKVGPHNLLVGQVGIAGSVTTGSYVVMGGQVGVAGHLRIADQVQIGAQSGVMEDIEEKGPYIGSPTMPALQAKRIVTHFLNLDELAKRVKELEKKLAELESK